MEECNHKSGSEGGVCNGCGYSFEYLFNQLRAENEALRAECQWSPEDDLDYADTWEGSCGVYWQFIDGGVKENQMNFCPRCGGKIMDKGEDND